jgi:hypothetical protein
MQVARIREELEYGGLRLRTTATVVAARVAVVVDIGFGDSIESGFEIVGYPVLLDLPAPKLQAYARETVVAEKFQAMIALGRANSRMKDFYDIWLISKSFNFEPSRLAYAIAPTFERRRTEIPTQTADALTPDFARDPQKQLLDRLARGSYRHDFPSLGVGQLAAPGRRQEPGLDRCQQKEASSL